MRRIDAHQHIWDLERGDYEWPTPADPAIYRTFDLADLAPELAAARIDSTVLVQAADSIADTEAMLDAAKETPFVGAVVGWAPMADRQAAESLLDGWGDDLIRGIRHLIHWETDPAWLIRPDLEDGFRMLAERRLAFDVVAVYPNHLHLVPAVADRHPDVAFVIDHLGKPPFRGDGWSIWVDRLQSAAERPNVFAKISGLDTAAGSDWSAGEIKPAVDVAINAFGPSRIMFGSDWPVCRTVSTYVEVVAAVEVIIGGLSATEQAAVMGGTAARVYRLAG